MNSGFVSRSIPWVVLLALIGFVLGYLTAPAHASTFFSVRINPGGSVEYLTCTWHGSARCGAGAGEELDWRGGGPYADNVNFRGWISRSGSHGTVGTVATVQDNGDCKTVFATVENALGGFVGDVEYTHTDITSPSTWYIYGNPSYNYQTKYIAEVTDDELDPCDPEYWSGPHLHQGHDGSFSHNSSRFTSAGAETIYGVNDWQYYDSWIY